jgi:hypothetical protein
MSALAIALLLVAGGTDEGLRAYREGRFADAQRAFAEAEKREGDGASAELLYDEALAALQAGDLSAAESAAERAAARGGARFAAARDFLLGNVAFVRCERAKAVATRPEAEPFAFDAAIALAETARRRWQLAAASRADWPEARRNVERALLETETLRKLKAAAEEKKKKASSSGPTEPPPPEKSEAPPPQTRESGDRRAEGQESEPAPAPRASEVELDAAQIARLFDRLFEQEREKQKLRRETRARRTDVEKDW